MSTEDTSMGKGSTGGAPSLENTWTLFVMVALTAGAGTFFGFALDLEPLWWAGVALSAVATLVGLVAVIATGVRIGVGARP